VDPRVTRRNAAIGLGVVACIVLLAVVGPYLAGDPNRLDIDRGLSALGAPLPPSAHAWLGTDALGRDVWARLVHGAGTSLIIALATTALSALIGVSIGLYAGYTGGRSDTLLMRLMDLALSFPFLLLAILLAALLHQANVDARYLPVIVPLASVTWTTFARLVRAKARVLAQSELVVAARSLGATDARVMLRHVLPNVAGVIAVVAAFAFAQSLLGEAVLSYLGLGPPQPEPTWGRMLYEGRAYYRSAPWLVIAPGVTIVAAVAAFNLLGDTLRDWLAPGERGAR
jgi:peptide/nickel transport system permease protein